MRVDRIYLIAKMAEKDMTLKRLCSITGVSRATLSAVRNGKKCSEDTGRKIAAALGVDVAEIVEMGD